MDGYFSARDAAAARLNKANFNVQMNSGLAQYLFGLYAGEHWAREFDYFQTVLRNDGVVQLAFERPRMADPILGEPGSSLLPVLRLCFERSIREHFQSLDVSTVFGRGVLQIFAAHAHRLANMETRLREFDSNKAEQLARGLEQKVAALADKFQRHFARATEYDIKKFIDEKKRGQKEDN